MTKKLNNNWPQNNWSWPHPKRLVNLPHAPKKKKAPVKPGFYEKLFGKK